MWNICYICVFFISLQIEWDSSTLVYFIIIIIIIIILLLKNALTWYCVLL